MHVLFCCCFIILFSPSAFVAFCLLQFLPMSAGSFQSKTLTLFSVYRSLTVSQRKTLHVVCWWFLTIRGFTSSLPSHWLLQLVTTLKVVFPIFLALYINIPKNVNIKHTASQVTDEKVENQSNKVKIVYLYHRKIMQSVNVEWSWCIVSRSISAESKTVLFNTYCGALVFISEGCQSIFMKYFTMNTVVNCN